MRNRPAGTEGFQPIKLRWQVERTFAWLGRYRRMSKDSEYYNDASEAHVLACSVHLLLRKLKPAHNHPMPPFSYPKKVSQKLLLHKTWRAARRQPAGGPHRRADAAPLLGRRAARADFDRAKRREGIGLRSPVVPPVDVPTGGQSAPAVGAGGRSSCPRQRATSRAARSGAATPRWARPGRQAVLATADAAQIHVLHDRLIRKAAHGGRRGEAEELGLVAVGFPAGARRSSHSINR